MSDDLQAFADSYVSVVDSLNDLLYNEVLPRSESAVTRTENRVQTVYSLTAESRKAAQFKTQILHLESIAETGNVKITMSEDQARALFYGMVKEIEELRVMIDYGLLTILGSDNDNHDYVSLRLKQKDAYTEMRTFYN